MPQNELYEAAFADADVLAYLSGFSGARIALMQSRIGRNRFVRKAAQGVVAAQRLADQKDRLLRLSQAFTGHIRFPEVYNEKWAGDCYWFDMEFVSGIDGVSFLSQATADRAQTYRNAVLDIWMTLQQGSHATNETYDLGKVIRRKLVDIDAKTEGRFSDTLEQIDIGAAGTSISVRPSLCHGDLTLENMIFDARGKIFLIDPIPSPIEYIWFDISKVFQDIEGRWFIHRRKKLPLGITLGICDLLTKDLQKKYPEYLEVHSIMLALCFARILPYCTTDEDASFIVNRISFALASRLGSGGKVR